MILNNISSRCEQYNKCKEKFVILQSIGVIAIKSSETKSWQSSTLADIPVDIFNSYNSANGLND